MPLNYNTIDDILEKYVPKDELGEIHRILYGWQSDASERYLGAEKLNNCDVQKYRFVAKDTVNPRIVKVAAIQHSIVLPTVEPIRDQRAQIFEKIEQMTEKASFLGANIVCFPETWSMPFGFCTRDKYPWCEYAEDVETGPSTSLARQLAKKHHMVIISPILKRDTDHGGILWNTAVIISECGVVLGKQRKNHIPHNGESSYYMAGSTGNQVFDTTFGKIGVTICFDRHQPLSWIMYGLNGAEIVFNTAATAVGEHWWPIEARNAAIAHSYYTVAVNRVGLEKFQTKTFDGELKEKLVGPFYGSTFISAPDGSRTKGLSTVCDGILFAELDLNLCQQMKETFGFDRSQRWSYYTNKWIAASELSFKPEIISESSNEISK